MPDAPLCYGIFPPLQIPNAATSGSNSPQPRFVQASSLPFPLLNRNRKGTCSVSVIISYFSCTKLRTTNFILAIHVQCESRWLPGTQFTIKGSRWRGLGDGRRQQLEEEGSPE
jgi:hypothetical protein